MRFVTISQAREAQVQLRTMDGSTDAKLSQLISTVKLKKIPVNSFNESQLKRVLILICKEKGLIASNFVDLSKVSVQIFQDAFRKILDDLGMIAAKTNELFVYGGQSGYLSSRFHRETRQLIELQEGTEYDCDIDQAALGSIIILDSDVSDALNCEPVTTSSTSGGEKRVAELDDTMFIGQVPEQQKPKMDGESGTDEKEALEALPDWETLKSDPATAAVVGRLQEFYKLKIGSITEQFEGKVELLEDAMLKKKEEDAKFRSLVEAEEEAIRENVNALRQELDDAQNARTSDQQLIRNLEAELQLQKQQVRKQTLDASNQSNIQMEIDAKLESGLKTNNSMMVTHEEQSSDTIMGQTSEAEITQIAKGQSSNLGQTRISQVKPATIGKFGIKVWTEENSLLDHMAQVHIGLEVAAESGHNSLSVQKSLIYQSLPARCHWTRSYVADETTVEGIIRKIVTLLEGGRELQLHAFMKIQRKRNEPLLEFFTKIRRIYGFSVGKKDSELASDAAAVSFMVQKMVEAMEESTAQEFTKRIETDLENGQLTFGKIADAIIRITRLAMKSNMTSGILAHVKSGQPKRCGKCHKRGHDDVNCWKDITCTKCDTKGHPADRCRKFPSQGEKRETDTDGRTCFECKQKGHVRSNCPNREVQDHSKWSQNQ